ncbi:Gfo/Idh/MocA family protein [Pedobacter arcticus]|uniref:Gfo/Idh/MocA family protein n=1 Tax=Pedobacter arcticus TaxID=752140 RepID=UPI0002DE475E|nr:Gfo/Idh/MocA family oxidoreductase [Pedobacter arcticus]
MRFKKYISRRNFLKNTTLTGLGIGLMPSFLYADQMPAIKGKRIGIIGLDTSHSLAFTKAINTNPSDFDNYQVVAAYPFGSQTIKSASERIPKYTEDVQKYAVKIVASITELLRQVDVVLLETNDGRMHLSQALQVINAGKPLFIDKPIAASLLDAAKIFSTAKQKNVPVFSSSSLRYMPGVQRVLSGAFGEVKGVSTYSPATLEVTHPDLYWYGIHGVEMLFSVMGPNCKSVSQVSTEFTDVVTGIWDDGRIGTFTGLRTGKADFGGTCFCEKELVQLGPFTGYNPLLKEVIKFFSTGIAPVSALETMQILAFMDAAEESKQQQAQLISLQSIYKKNGLDIDKL